MSDSPPTPAGWYPDPENPGAQRWWDGTQWAAPTPNPAPVPAAPSPAAPPDEDSSTRRTLLVIAIILLLLLLLGGGVLLFTRRSSDPVASSGGSPTVSLATAPKTQEGLLDSVRSYWAGLLNRGFETTYSYRSKDCRSRSSVEDERAKSTEYLRTLEQQVKRPVDASLSIGDIGVTSFNGDRATVAYVDLDAPDGGTVTNRDETKPTEWVYEGDAWHLTTC